MLTIYMISLQEMVYKSNTLSYLMVIVHSSIRNMNFICMDSLSSFIKYDFLTFDYDIFNLIMISICMDSGHLPRPCQFPPQVHFN